MGIRTFIDRVFIRILDINDGLIIYFAKVLLNIFQTTAEFIEVSVMVLTLITGVVVLDCSFPSKHQRKQIFKRKKCVFQNRTCNAFAVIMILQNATLMP